MKAVMISIRPEWCQKIISGEKTVELRKSFPAADKVKTPFKCYIYCTSNTPVLWRYEGHTYLGNPLAEWPAEIEPPLNGKVIGEFVCDAIYWAVSLPDNSPDYLLYHQTAILSSCLTLTEVENYADGKSVYGWHISDLVIYDKPKELSEFFKPCIHGAKDISCFECEKSGYSLDLKIECCNRMERAPQSWCYVEEKHG